MMKKLSIGSIYVICLILVGLIIFPFITDSRTLTILLTQIFIFAIFAMSYDILLGYTGIVSFRSCDVFWDWGIYNCYYVEAIGYNDLLFSYCPL